MGNKQTAQPTHDTDDGNVVGDRSTSQIVKAEDGSTISGVTLVAGGYHAAPPTPAPATAPAPPDYFTGRHDELDALAQALTSGDTPQAITALQGMGGIGKTALAAQLAAKLNGTFPGGVFWADLPASDGDPLPVLAAWARLCGHDVSALPDPQARAQAVRGILAGRVKEQGRLLVVLDDVRGGWLDGARALQSARPPGVPLLLTTRDEELALALGATVRRLDVLPLEKALELLAALAGPVVEREPEAARRLAERVGCLPLELELAGKLAALRARKPGWQLASLAAQVEVRAAEALRLKGQHGLVACFSLSYDTLDPEGQRLFRVLGVFAPAPYAAGHVAAVLGWEVGATEAGLDALVALSLARWEGGGEGEKGRVGEGERVRYSLHPLLRDYAAALLEEAGEAPAARVAHTAHYLAYAEAHDQPTAADYDALEAERPNLLAAMDRAYREEQWAQVRRFAWALCRPSSGYLGVRGYWGELRARLEQAVRAAEAEGNKRDTAAFIHNLAILAQDTGEYDEARRLYRQSLEINEELGNRAGIASTLHQLGGLAQDTGEYDKARRLYRQSLEINEELGDRAVIASTLHELGRLAQDTGEYDEARRLYRQSLEINEELGNRAVIASTLHELGRLAQATGEVDEARRLYRQSLEIEEELGNRAGIAITLGQLGVLAQATGEYDEARRLYRQGLDINEELGNRAGIAITLHNLAALAQATGEYDEARRLYRQSLDIKEELGNRVGIALTLWGLGNLAKDQGDLAEARRQYEEALPVFQELGDKKNEAGLLGQLANLADDEGDQAEAERLYRQAIAAGEELGDVVWMSIHMFNLALLYEDQGRLDKALPLLERAVEVAEQVGMPVAESRRRVLERVRGKLQ